MEVIKMTYQEIHNIIYSPEHNYTLVQSTGDFQCPDTGWGCVIHWNTDNNNMWAEICEDGIWDITKCDEQVKLDTIKWCENFGIKKIIDVQHANMTLTNILGIEEAKLYYFDEY
jgi:hypothetical protein